MKEDFLHYLWKHKKFDLKNLKTTAGESLQLYAVGSHNMLSGPDFFNARISINGQQWAGNIELHIKSSQWYAHGHENDSAYDNVILHVVWEDDATVYSKNENPIPTLILKDYVEAHMLNYYQKLFTHQGKQFINCEQDFEKVPAPLVHDWLERIYLERLERKVSEIELLVSESKNDWAKVLFIQLARSFGTKINAQAFAHLAKSLPFKVIRKVSQNKGQLEALLLGFAGLLPDLPDLAVSHRRQEYEFMKNKYGLPDYMGPPMQFFRLRPPNFPTLRLAQLAQLYEEGDFLFQKIIEVRNVEELRELFKIKASSYWDTHYNFKKSHGKKVKNLSRGFIDLLLINTVIPIRFAYIRNKSTGDVEEIIKLISEIPSEKNQIVKNFRKLRDLPENAMSSQALLQLKSTYCDPNRCLHCRVGNYLLSQNPLRNL